MKDSLEKRFQNVNLYIQEFKRQSGNRVVEKQEMRNSKVLQYGAVIEGRRTLWTPGQKRC